MNIIIIRFNLYIQIYIYIIYKVYRLNLLYDSQINILLSSILKILVSAMSYATMLRLCFFATKKLKGIYAYNTNLRVYFIVGI